MQAVAAITLASLVGPLGNSSLYASNSSIRPTIDLTMGFLDSLNFIGDAPRDSCQHICLDDLLRSVLRDILRQVGALLPNLLESFADQILEFRFLGGSRIDRVRGDGFIRQLLHHRLGK
jgi:hypothetical protein